MTEQGVILPGRILGVDLGVKRTGLAVSDEFQWTTRSLGNLTPKSRAQDIDFILAKCIELDVRTVVIGYPVLPVSQEEGAMALRARGFFEKLLAEALERKITLKICLQDEYLTSREADFRLRVSGIKKKSRPKEIDCESARVLIENYIADSRVT